MNISFIIPCYNCENYIKKNILRLYKKLKILKIKFEIILIDDFSSDKTYLRLNELRNLNDTRYNFLKEYVISKYSISNQILLSICEKCNDSPELFLYKINI